MAILKCTVCGGELDINGEMTVGVCKYCDSTIMIPKNLDRKGNLYNRAVFLRQNNEFDKASDVYEEILKEDNSDAEAHWGLVLSKFGIEYIDDPKTGEKIPTCHRTQANSILSDIDYKATLQYASNDAKSVIEKEALRISDIQKRIIEISQKESPYDIFICYKESDEFGNRTQDSTLAQEVYYELNKRGYNVFFARKSLESRLGDEYEPIIYAALNSSKVMVVVGTKPEHFNAVWVRNEWSRFLEMGQNQSKTIIPAYRDMSPYELPSELSALQSLDMSKLGFIQDLTDGIDKILNGSGYENKSYSVIESNNHNDLERLLQNGETYMNLGNYIEANEVYKSVTKLYPEDYRGWWGVILSSTNNLKEATASIQDVSNVLFGYVKQLAPTEAFKNIESEYVEYTKLVAEKCLDEEKNIIEKRISDINMKSALCSDAIRGLNNQIKYLNEGITSEEKSYINRIKGADDSINRVKGTYGYTKFSLILGIVLTVIAILLFICQHYVWFVIASLVAIIGYGGAFSDGHSPSKDKNMILSEEKRKEQIIQSYENNIKEQQARIVELNEEIASNKNQINQNENKIKEYREYISNYQNEIRNHWFHEKCKNFGVDVECDQNFENYRNSLLS